MKRGRPNKRYEIQNLSLDILKSSNTPMTISAMAGLISKKLNERVSWNTVHKYVYELVQTDKIQPTILLHSKSNEKPGLTVYSIKK